MNPALVEGKGGGAGRRTARQCADAKAGWLVVSIRLVSSTEAGSQCCAPRFSGYKDVFLSFLFFFVISFILFLFFLAWAALDAALWRKEGTHFRRDVVSPGRMTMLTVVRSSRLSPVRPLPATQRFIVILR